MPLGIKSFPAGYLILFFITITAFLAVQGCTAAAVPAVAYGVSKISAPKTESAQQAPPAASLRTYPEYLTEMERINMEREKAGLSPRPIMNQEEWVTAQAAGRSPTAPAPPPAAPVAEVPATTSEAK